MFKSRKKQFLNVQCAHENEKKNYDLIRLKVVNSII